MKPTYNRLAFDYGHEGEGLQEVVNGVQTRLLALDGTPLILPAEYGCSVVEADIPAPAWAPEITTDEAPPPAPDGFTYVLVPNV